MSHQAKTSRASFCHAVFVNVGLKNVPPPRSDLRCSHNLSARKCRQSRITPHAQCCHGFPRTLNGLSGGRLSSEHPTICHEQDAPGAIVVAHIVNAPLHKARGKARRSQFNGDLSKDLLKELEPRFPPFVPCAPLFWGEAVLAHAAAGFSSAAKRGNQASAACSSGIL
eukprot:3777445-Amphidinium_carterae.1